MEQLAEEQASQLFLHGVEQGWRLVQPLFSDELRLSQFLELCLLSSHKETLNLEVMDAPLEDSDNAINEILLPTSTNKEFDSLL